jgi:hypothetical protein
MKVNLQLILRGIIGGAYFLLLFFNQGLLLRILNFGLLSIRLYQLIWLALILIVIKDMIPSTSHSPGIGKAFLIKPGEKNTPKVEEILRQYTKKTNRKAIAIGFFWFSLLLGVGLLYYFNIIGPYFLFSLAVVGIFLDELFISEWCPFKVYINNKCCKVCRILSWGPLMVFCFLIYIPNFYTYSLIFVSLLMFLQWEYLHRYHSERFFELANSSLSCVNCRNKCAKLLKENK